MLFLHSVIRESSGTLTDSGSLGDFSNSGLFIEGLGWVGLIRIRSVYDAKRNVSLSERAPYGRRGQTTLRSGG